MLSASVGVYLVGIFEHFVSWVEDCVHGDINCLPVDNDWGIFVTGRWWNIWIHVSNGIRGRRHWKSRSSPEEKSSAPTE